MVSYLNTLFLGKPHNGSFLVPILSSVTDNLFFLNQQKREYMHIFFYYSNSPQAGDSSWPLGQSSTPLQTNFISIHFLSLLGHSH